MSRRQVDYGPPSVDKRPGALPVVAGFARRLDIAGTVDRAARCATSRTRATAR